MCSQEQETEALLQQVALSLANITFAIDTMLTDEVSPSLEQVRTGLEMIRNHTEATAERIYSHKVPKTLFEGGISSGAISQVISRFNRDAA